MFNIREKEKIVMDKSMGKPELTSQKSLGQGQCLTSTRLLLLLPFVCLYFCTKLAETMQLLQGKKPEKSMNGSLSARTLDILIHLVKAVTVCCIILGKTPEAI